MRPVWFVGFVGLLIAAAVLYAMSPVPGPSQGRALLVVASIYPLGELARLVGGPQVDIHVLVPVGAEAHDWEPSPQQIVTVRRARLILINGAEMEIWSGRLPALAPGTPVVTAAEGIPVRQVGGHPDPHFWLDPVVLQRMIADIAKALEALDPAHRPQFDVNAAAAIRTFAAIHDEYTKTLARCATRSVIVSHGALGYLASRYRFDAISIGGQTPEGEPTPGRLAELIQVARARQIHYVLAEPLEGRQVATTLAREIGGSVLTFHPAESLTKAEAAQRTTLEQLFRQNLDVLGTAMECAP